MAFGIHEPADFLAPPTELDIAGAPSPAAFRHLLKLRLVSRGLGGLEAAWRIDAEVDGLLGARLVHLVWALGVRAEAARSGGLAVESRGWLAGMLTASALGLVDYDPGPLLLSGADGLAGTGLEQGAHITLGVPPSAIGETATWFLAWGRRRRRRFTVALVAPSGRLLPFDWEDVRELAVARGRSPRPLTLAWVPDERVVQVPWGETADGFPVALLPETHLAHSGVHLVTLEPDPLLAAAVRRRPGPEEVAAATSGERERRAGAVGVSRRAALDDPAVFELLSSGWIPAVMAHERPMLASLCRGEQPSSFEELVTLVALAEDELRRDYFLERYQARRGAATLDHDPLPSSVASAVLGTRGLILFQEQVAALIAMASGWEAGRAFALTRALADRAEEAAAPLERVWDDALARGISPDELRAVALAVARYAPIALSRRDATPRAALICELAALRLAGR